MRYSIIVTTIVNVLFAANVFAADDAVITTPRGAKVNVKTHKAAGTNQPLLVVAPGQGCNWLGSMFETIATKGAERGYTVVRFNWNYCNTNPSDPQPSDKFVNEIEDFNAVLKFAKELPGVDTRHVFLAGKSLGSMVGQRVFTSHTDLQALALLTPVCSYETDDNGNPYPAPLPVTDESYPGLKNDKRQILMAGGSNDPICFLPILHKYLGDSKGNIVTATVGGDHGLNIKNQAGTVDQSKTANNINAFVGLVLNWLDLQL
jgi:predicted alpha/beta-hydrolase family hydrolase